MRFEVIVYIALFTMHWFDPMFDVAIGWFDPMFDCSSIGKRQKS